MADASVRRISCELPILVKLVFDKARMKVLMTLAILASAVVIVSFYLDSGWTHEQPGTARAQFRALSDL